MENLENRLVSRVPSGFDVMKLQKKKRPLQLATSVVTEQHHLAID